MKFRLVNIVFIIIGVAIGAILALQIRAQPLRIGSYPLDQLEIQKALLTTFSLEQDELRKKLEAAENKLQEADTILSQRSSSKTLKTLARLKYLSGVEAVQGEGIRITLHDNPAVARIDFSAIDENFIQATDLRDLVNNLFLQDAEAIAINGKRIMALTAIQPVFDSILVGNFQMNSPFIIEAIGDPESLKEAVNQISTKRKIQIFVESPISLRIPPLEGMRSTKFLSFYSQ